MPKTKVSEWDTTAGNNSDVGGTNIAENCAAANVNDALRTIMAQIATALSGSDDSIITGTAGGDGDFAAFNADGDLVAATGTANVESLAGLTLAANKGLYSTAANTLALFDLTSAGLALLDDADASAQRTTLELGTAAVAALIDDDTMATATATNIASAESTKAYVDNTIPLTRTSASTTTGGTSIDFTSLPSGVNEVEIYLTGVSLSGTAGILIQIGDSGGVETTGYDAGCGFGSGGSTSTEGFIIAVGSASYELTAVVTLRHMGSNKWIMGSQHHLNGATDATTAAGFKTLSGELDRVRITTTNGTDTIDANSGIQVATR